MTIEGIHPTFEKALKLDAEKWTKGDRPIIAITESESRYIIQSNGDISGGHHIKNGATAHLQGAVYRRGGPIRLGQVVLGLGIEAWRDGDRKTLTTTPVVSMAYLAEPSDPEALAQMREAGR